MKRVFIIAGLLPAIAGSLLAQNQSADCVLDRFLEDVKEAPALQMDFLWNQTAEGTLILQENMFVVHLDEFHVYCNGREKWLYNQGIDEWEELPHDAQAAGILENPSAFFTQLRDGFYLSPASVQKENPEGRSVWELNLVPYHNDSVFTWIILQLEEDGLQLRNIRYGLADGTAYAVKLLSFETISARDPGFFTPNISLGMP